MFGDDVACLVEMDIVVESMVVLLVFLLAVVALLVVVASLLISSPPSMVTSSTSRGIISSNLSLSSSCCCFCNDEKDCNCSRLLSILKIRRSKFMICCLFLILPSLVLRLPPSMSALFSSSLSTSSEIGTFNSSLSSPVAMYNLIL